MAHILKPSRIDEAQREKLLAEVEKDRQRLNAAVGALASPEIGIKIKSVEELQKISIEWLRGYLTQSYEQFISASGFVPNATKQRVLSEYNQTGALAEAHCRDIESILEKWADFPVKQDSKGCFWFDSKTVKAWATTEATRIFSDAEREYYSLLGKLFDTLNEVSEFERDHKMRPFAVHGVQVLTPNGVGRRWYTDYFCERNAQGAPIGDLHLTTDSYVRLVSLEGLFPPTEN